MRKAGDALRRCYEGGAWRGNQLSVQIVRAKGRAGRRYEVRLDSLPPDLQARYWAENPAPAEGPTQVAPVTAPALPAAAPAMAAPPAIPAPKDWQGRLELLRPAFAHPPRSRERGAAIHETSRRFNVSQSTIRAWMRAYKDKGYAALKRKARSDKGRRRQFIGRVWDREVPFDEAVKRKTEAKLLRKVGSLWAGGAPGRRHVARLATTELIRLTRGAGLDLPDAKMLKLCAVPRAFVKRGRPKRIIATHTKDAKGFSDRHVPRVRRSRADLAPMQCVAGDVHHGDNLVARPDGSTCTAKCITWHDLATNRVFMTIVFLEKGEGIRQEHVIASFIEMTQHPEWGMPAILVLDNGTEYDWTGFIDDAMRLSSLTIADLSSEPDVRAEVMAARRGMTIKNRPYQPQGKVTETVFAVLEGGAFRMLPAHIGGNRMAKKTCNVGREMPAFEGGYEAYRAEAAAALGYYETQPQTGHLIGKSPREAFAEKVAAGWRRVDIDPHALHAVFARDAIRTVKQGAFTLDNRTYSHKALLTRTGQRVRVRVPLAGARDRLAILDDADNLVCLAAPAPVYGFLDPAGARDQAARAKEQRRQIADLRAETDPVDLTAEMRAAATLHAPAPVPESAGTIRLSDEIEAVGAAQKALGKVSKRSQRDKAHDDQRARYQGIESAVRAVGGARR